MHRRPNAFGSSIAGHETHACKRSPAGRMRWERLIEHSTNAPVSFRAPTCVDYTGRMRSAACRKQSPNAPVRSPNAFVRLPNASVHSRNGRVRSTHASVRSPGAFQRSANASVDSPNTTMRSRNACDGCGDVRTRDSTAPVHPTNARTRSRNALMRSTIGRERPRNARAPADDAPRRCADADSAPGGTPSGSASAALRRPRTAPRDPAVQAPATAPRAGRRDRAHRCAAGAASRRGCRPPRTCGAPGGNALR